MGKERFLVQLPQDVTILDVGCGNNSPSRTKGLLPNSYYVGLDIGDYNQTKPNLANEYVITTPSEFSAKIRELGTRFDVVVSTHNIEHCNLRNETLEAMLYVTKPGGRIFLSFPCEQSVDFPRRKGTLNYYDDPTHLQYPPNFDEFIQKLRDSKFEVIYSTKNYKPTILRIIGFILEPFSAVSKKVYLGTWQYYGFESIIIAQKKVC